MKPLYGYVALSRIDFGGFRLFGPGLGNLLFPWARAVVAAHTEGVRLLWPTWPQVKVGPILRGESAPRFYAGLFRNHGGYVDGARKLALMVLSQRVTELEFRKPGFAPSGARPILVVFGGLGGRFEPIIRHRPIVRQELIRMSTEHGMQDMPHDFQRSISVHVRLGDFAPPDPDALRGGAYNVRLPLDWVIETVLQIRKSVAQDWPVFVFSDGTESELSPLLALPGAKRAASSSPLADMLSMSRSNVLVVSSTFSRWSAFLGAVPSVYYPGQLRQRLLGDNAPGEIEREPRAALPAAFAWAIQRRTEALS